jgi:DNA-binding NarL/FixJ family response regulator
LIGRPSVVASNWKSTAQTLFGASAFAGLAVLAPRRLRRRRFRAGASGFLLKNAPPEQLVEAVRVLAAGDALLAPQVTRRVIEAFATAPRMREPEPGAVAELTPREREVLTLIAQGLSNAQIADQLFLGVGTVKTHVARILTKLGLTDRVQAVVFAYEMGLAVPGAGRRSDLI